jgi:hypothetical protein
MKRLAQALAEVRMKTQVHSLRARFVERSSGRWRVELTAWGPRQPMKAEHPKHAVEPFELADDAAASEAIEWAWQASANEGLEPSWIELHFKAPVPDEFQAGEPTARLERLLKMAIGARPRAWQMQKRKGEDGEVEAFELRVRCEGLDGGRVLGRIAKVKPLDSLHLKNWISRVLEPRGFFRDG